MNPEEQKPLTEVEALKQLTGGMQALRVVMSQMERHAANMIWNAKPNSRRLVNKCIMDAVGAFYAALERCEYPAPPAGGSGPDCGAGYHEEFGNCVKDPPGN